MELGYLEEEKCNRDGCAGIIDEHEVENCSCHIHPPCSKCTAQRNFCPVCGWEQSDDPLVVDDVTEYSIGPQFQLRPVNSVRRILDNTKIDFVSLPNSSASMIKRGVYPEGTTSEQVREVVNGTFGGVFNSFGNGRFEFKAYTD